MIAEHSEVSGDRVLSVPEQRRYLTYGLRQCLDHFRDRYPTRSHVLGNSCSIIHSTIDAGASPLRVYTVSVMVGLQVSLAPGWVCDLGCGPGHHHRYLSDGPSRPYLGVDLVRRASWSGGSEGTVFVQMSASQVGLRSATISSVFSSSSLEHMQDARAAIREARRIMAPRARAVHVVPSVWSLFLYGQHGYRRFAPGSLSRLFVEEGYVVSRVERLGGFASFLLHLCWISILESRAFAAWLPWGPLPRILRRLPTPGVWMRRGPLLRLYRVLLRLALRIDRLIPVWPSGYAFYVEPRD